MLAEAMSVEASELALNYKRFTIPEFLNYLIHHEFNDLLLFPALTGPQDVHNSQSPSVPSN